MDEISPEAGSPRRASYEVERRIVTVLFADLVGFTTLSDRLDPEDVATAQDAYFAEVRTVVNRYGGTLEKFIGDAGVAAFGVPRARDDDAERAVRAGLALIAAVERVGAELGLGPTDLRLRVGINTGEVAHVSTGPDAGRITGDTVNVAARLQTAAPPGGLLVGQPTADAVSAVALLAPSDPLLLKGKTAPTAACLVTGLRAEPSREQAMGGLRAPLIGRETELAVLQNAIDQVDGRAERWLIVAAPGVGKSRLLTELSAVVADRVRVLEVRMRPDLLNPYQVVRDLLWAALGHPAARDAAEQSLHRVLARSGLPVGRADVVVAEVSAVLNPADPASGHSPSTDREARFAAWLDAFDALDADADPGRPAVWLVEDVHWAGGDLLAFLDSAGRRSGPGGRLVLATARPAVLDTAPGWCAADGDGVHRLSLEQLPPPDTVRLVRALIGDVLPATMLDAVAERADGNPLFVEELLRSWVSTGTLVVGDDDSWQLARPAQQVDLPPTVRAIYAAQLDDLPADARSLARRASVAGRRFPMAALPALEVINGASAVEMLLRRALLTGPHPDPGAGDVYAYRHALLRDAGYASLARADRARLHVRLARWLEATVVEVWSDAAELIGRHYASAAENAPALGRDFGNGFGVDHIRTLAGDWLERAAEIAVRVAAHNAAQVLLEQALDVAPRAPVLVRTWRLLRLGEITAHSADMAAGARLLEQACASYESALDLPPPDGEQARDAYAAAIAALAGVRFQQLAFVEGAVLTDTALRRIGDRDDLATTRLLTAHAHCILAGRDDTATAIPQLERALPLAERYGDPALRLVVLAALAGGATEARMGDAQLLKQVEALARSVPDWAEAAHAMSNQALCHLASGDVVAARSAVDRTAELCTAQGLTERAGWADYVRAEIGLFDGDWDGALHAGRRAIALASARGFSRLRARTWIVLMPIAAARGERATLEACASWASPIGAGPDSPYSRITITAVQLWLADAGFGESFVPDVPSRLASFDARALDQPSWTAAVERVVDAWLVAGELDAVRHVIDHSARARRSHSYSPLAEVAEGLMRTRLALAQGDTSHAYASAQAAAHLAEQAGLLWWRLQACRILAELHPENRMVSSARDALELALRIPSGRPQPKTTR